MKRIRIFLASSITDLKFDRIEIGNFFRQLNDIYIESGIYFELAMCEDYDNGIALEGKQSELDKLICDSELVFFIFFKRVGEYTVHEFEVALENYKNCQKPKIVTYFKTVDNAEEASDEVVGFMNMLDTELRHYYNMYREIDTLKLGMLMQIKLMRLDNSEFSIEDGKLLYGKAQIAETKNIPMFECNEKLKDLKDRLFEADKKFREAKVALLKDGSDDNYLAFSDAATEKDKAQKSLKELESAILDVAEKMYESTTDGRILSEKQKQAYRHMERGEWEIALSILDKNEILTELSHNEKLSDGIRQRVEVNTNELLQRIEVLKAAGLDKASIEEILSIYSVAYDTIVKHNLDLNPLREYANFLHVLNYNEDALRIIEKLSYLYNDPDRSVSLKERAELLLERAKICVGLKRYDEAIEIVKNGYETVDKLFEIEGAQAANVCGSIWNIGGNAYLFQRKKSEALTHYEKAKEYFEIAYKHDPENCKGRLAMIYDNYGIVLEDFERYEEAQAYHQRSERLYFELAQQDDKYKISLARCYHNTALGYKDQNQLDKAEEYFLSSIELREEIRQKNPATIEPHLSGSYYSLGWLYKHKRNKEKSLDAFNKSKKIRIMLRKRSITYDEELRNSYISLMCDSTGLFSEQEKNEARGEYLKLLLSLPELSKVEKEDLLEDGQIYLFEKYPFGLIGVFDDEEIENNKNELELELKLLMSIIDAYYENRDIELYVSHISIDGILTYLTTKLQKPKIYTEYIQKLNKS